MPTTRAKLKEIRAAFGDRVAAQAFGVPQPTIRRWGSQGVPKTREKRLGELYSAFGPAERATLKKRRRKRYKTPAKVRAKRRVTARKYVERRRALKKELKRMIAAGEMVQDVEDELIDEFEVSDSILWKEFRTVYGRKR